MKNRSFTLLKLAECTGAELVGEAEGVIDSFADLVSARPNQASFLAHPRYARALHATQAGAIFVSPETARPEGKNYLLHPNPSAAFQQLIELLYDPEQDASGFEGVHPSAVLHSTVKLGKNVRIGPHVSIDRECEIGDGTKIDAGVCIGVATTIGKECRLYSQVVIRERCRIGDRVVIQPGAVVGSCGFGFIPRKDGSHQKLKQVGTVVIEDDVEIGANTTIDRGRFQTTRIGKGTKIDNLVMVGHGVEIGEHCLLVAQTGIAGSTKIGNCCRFGGQVAINGHIEIGDAVSVAAKSGVSKSLAAGGTYGGIPVQPIAQHNRMSVFLRKIESFVKRIEKLEQND